MTDPFTPIVLDGVACLSTDTRLEECSHNAVVEDCSHSDDVGAFCTNIIGLCVNIITLLSILMIPVSHRVQ